MNDQDHNERRTKRLIFLFIISSIPFIIAAILNHHHIFMLQAYMLTALQYGYILYIDEAANIKKLWLWKAMMPVTVLHIVVLAVVNYINVRVDSEILKPLGVMALLWMLALPEYFVMSLVIELYRPKIANPEADCDQILRFPQNFLR